MRFLNASTPVSKVALREGKLTSCQGCRTLVDTVVVLVFQFSRGSSGGDSLLLLKARPTVKWFLHVICSFEVCRALAQIAVGHDVEASFGLLLDAPV